MSWFGDILTNIFAPGEVERGRQLDQQLSVLNRQMMNDQEFEDFTRRAADQSAETYSAQIEQGWNEGLQEGYANVTGTVRETLKAPFRLAWDIIPWQIWLIALVYLGWRLYQTGILQRYISVKLK